MAENEGNVKVYPPPSQWRLHTPGGIPFRLVSRRGSFEAENAEATEEYMFEAHRLLDLVTEAFPFVIFAGSTFYYPQQNGMGGLPSLVPQRLRWEPWDGGLPIDPFDSESLIPGTTPPNTYDDYIRVFIEYGPRPENSEEQDPDLPQTIMEINANASTVLLADPVVNKKDTAARWVEDDEDVNEARIPFMAIENEIEWSLHWPRVPAVYWVSTLIPKLRDMIGAVNSEAMPLFNDSPTDTILFIGYSGSQRFTWRRNNDGSRLFPPIDFRLKFLEKNFKSVEGVQVTHQKMYRPGHGWRTIEINGENLFARKNLNTLWR